MRRLFIVILFSSTALAQQWTTTTANGDTIRPVKATQGISVPFITFRDGTLLLLSSIQNWNTAYTRSSLLVADSTNWNLAYVRSGLFAADSANWNTAYTDRLKWDGGATGLVAATGRTSLELKQGALLSDTTKFKLANDSTDATTGYTTLYQNAQKVTKNAAITGATKTKITYDVKGLVTSGADAGISDITALQDSLTAKLNRGEATSLLALKLAYSDTSSILYTRFRTDSLLALKEPTLTKGNLTTSSPLSFSATRQVIGGAAVLVADTTHLTQGLVTQAQRRLDSSYAVTTYTPKTRAITIAGNTPLSSSAAGQDLSADRTWTLSVDTTNGRKTSLTSIYQHQQDSVLAASKVASVTAGNTFITTGGTATAPTILSDTTKYATTSVSGFLKSQDWTTFNNKVTSVAAGNTFITTGGTASAPTILSDTTKYATSAVSGFLKFSDWVAFNAKQAALGTGNLLPLNSGGTAANLTASNGGIFYSTASAGAILAGTATAGQMLQSGSSTTPAWSTSTYPATNAVNTLLYASSANVMAALATANNGVLITSATGVPSLLVNGTTGQLLTATTGSPPTWTTVASGSGLGGDIVATQIAIARSTTALTSKSTFTFDTTLVILGGGFAVLNDYTTVPAGDDTGKVSIGNNRVASTITNSVVGAGFIGYTNNAVTNSDVGTFAIGKIGGLVTNSGVASLFLGLSVGTTNSVTGSGSVGYVNTSNLTLSGAGSYHFGYVASGNIVQNGNGSSFVGFTSTGNIQMGTNNNQLIVAYTGNTGATTIPVGTTVSTNVQLRSNVSNSTAQTYAATSSYFQGLFPNLTGTLTFNGDHDIADLVYGGSITLGTAAKGNSIRAIQSGAVVQQTFTIAANDSGVLALLNGYSSDAKPWLVTDNATNPATNMYLVAGGLSSFGGLNSGTATASTGDSIQVSITGITATSQIVPWYTSNTALGLTVIPISVGNVQTGKFTIFATDGKTVSYFVVRR